MFTWILPALEVALKLLGLVDKAGQVFHDWQEQQKGKLALRKDQLEATKQEAIDANRTASDVAKLSDSDLNAALSRRLPDKAKPPAA